MSHYEMGATVYTHRDKKVTSIVGNKSADSFFSNSNFDRQTKPAIIPPGFKNRPDMISDLFYNGPDMLWLLCLSSNKYDVFEDFTSGEIIRIPR